MAITIRFLAAAAILAALQAIPAAAFQTDQGQARRYIGRSVAEVLSELQRTTLRIIFSSEVVPAALRVEREPRSTEPREIALEILEPHGLTLQQGPGGTLLVVRAQRPKRPQARPAPQKPPDRPRTPEPETPPLPRVEQQVEVIDRAEVTGVGTRAPSFGPATVQEMAGNMENVLQTLRILPSVAAMNDDEGKFAVRGAGPEHNIVVLDGIQIHNPYRLGEWTSSFLNPATAASVSLDPAGLDARQGGRLSSVISLETRDGVADRRLALSGSLGLTSGDVLFEGRMPGTETGSWWATARGTYYGLVSSTIIDEPIPTFVDVQFKTTLYPSPQTRLTIFGLTGREMRTQFGVGSDAGVLFESRVRGTNRVAAASLRWMPSSRVVSDTIVSGSLGTSRYFDVPRREVPGFESLERHVRVSDAGIRHQVMFDLANGHVIDAGVEAHRVGSSWWMVGRGEPETWRGIGPSTWGELVDYAAGPIDARLRRTQAGVWIQDRFDLGSIMTIEPGVRLDWNSYTGEASLQPRLRAARRVGATSLWAGFAVQAQTPSHESLQGFDYLELRPGNPEGLRNARSFQVVAGAARAFGGGVSVRVDAYRRWFDRLLVQRPENDVERASRLRIYVIPPDLPPEHSLLERRPTIFPESSGRGDSIGLELMVRRDGRLVSGWLAYGLSKATRELFGRTVPFDFDRRHALNAAVEIRPWSRVRAALTWQAASGFPVTPVLDEVDFHYLVRPDGTRDDKLVTFRKRDGTLTTSPNFLLRRLSTYNSDRTSAYARTDARFTYSTLGHWEFYGEILNLFNARNIVQTVQQGDGTSVVGIPLEVYDTFGRMVSYGLRVKF